MSKKTVRFKAIKTIKKPAIVKFRTKGGRIVSFKAVRTIKKPIIVRFRAKKAKKK
jgi:hypothetical protein